MNGPAVKKFYKDWSNNLLEYDNVTVVSNKKVFEDVNELWLEDDEDFDGDYVMTASL